MFGKKKDHNVCFLSPNPCSSMELFFGANIIARQHRRTTTAQITYRHMTTHDDNDDDNKN